MAGGGAVVEDGTRPGYGVRSSSGETPGKTAGVCRLPGTGVPSENLEVDGRCSVGKARPVTSS